MSTSLNHESGYLPNFVAKKLERVTRGGVSNAVFSLHQLAVPYHYQQVKPVREPFHLDVCHA